MTFMFGFNVISHDFDIYTDETYIDTSVEQVAIINGGKSFYFYIKNCYSLPYFLKIVNMIFYITYLLSSIICLFIDI